jgi:glycosyltransferase involved in cell wall biosynthesis
MGKGESVRAPGDAVMKQAGSKTVLIVDYYFPPLAGAGAHRSLGYVRHLQGFGWTPVVLTAEPGSHVFCDTTLVELIPEGLPVLRTASIEPDRLVKRVLTRASRHPTIVRGRGPALRKLVSNLTRVSAWLMFPDRRIGWFPFAVAAGRGAGRRFSPDVIYSTSTSVTSHLVADTLRMLWGIPWIADFQDPWTEPYATEFPTPLHRQAAIAVEHLIVHHADQVTVTTEPMRAAYRRRYPRAGADKFHVIPMGYDPRVFRGLHRMPQHKFVVTHFGNFYATRSPGPFLQALAACLEREPSLRDNAEIRFVGSFEPRLRNVAESLTREHRLDGVLRLLDWVPYRDGLQHLMNSDVLLLVSDPGGCGQNLVPSKLFEYFAVGRPVLALAPPGAIAGLMREAKVGLVVPPDDVHGIQNAILALYRQWRENTLACQPNTEFVAGCTWQARTGRFAAVLDAALGRGEASRVLARS